jgi:hypothetical protein
MANGTLHTKKVYFRESSGQHQKQADIAINSLRAKSPFKETAVRTTTHDTSVGRNKQLQTEKVHHVFCRGRKDHFYYDFKSYPRSLLKK